MIKQYKFQNERDAYNHMREIHNRIGNTSGLSWGVPNNLKDAYYRYHGNCINYHPEGMDGTIYQLSW